MWCVKFTFETILTEISHNLRIPHFPLFQIFAQMQHTLYRMEEVLASLEDVAEKASGLEDLVSLSQQNQLSESLHPSRPRPRAQVPPIDY